MEYIYIYIYILGVNDTTTELGAYETYEEGDTAGLVVVLFVDRRTTTGCEIV